MRPAPWATHPAVPRVYPTWGDVPAGVVVAPPRTRVVFRKTPDGVEAWGPFRRTWTPQPGVVFPGPYTETKEN